MASGTRVSSNQLQLQSYTMMYVFDVLVSEGIIEYYI